MEEDVDEGTRSLSVCVPGSAGAAGTTFTVTNTNDSGAGSLRQAILDANANPGGDTIAFGIPGAGVHTITPATGSGEHRTPS